MERNVNYGRMGLVKVVITVRDIATELQAVLQLLQVISQ